jgi:hypothetical protein
MSLNYTKVIKCIVLFLFIVPILTVTSQASGNQTFKIELVVQTEAIMALDSKTVTLTSKI